MDDRIYKTRDGMSSLRDLLDGAENNPDFKFDPQALKDALEEARATLGMTGKNRAQRRALAKQRRRVKA
jgi:hypothetical protein